MTYIYMDDERDINSIKTNIYSYKGYKIVKEQYGSDIQWVILDRNLKKVVKEPERRLKDCKAYIDKILK